MSAWYGAAVIFYFVATVPRMPIALVLTVSSSIFIFGLILGALLKLDRARRVNHSAGIMPDHLLPLNRLIASKMINADAPEAVQLGTEYGAPGALYMTVSMREHNPHVLITGCEGTGKTRFLANTYVRDIRRSKLVIDTYGDLVDLLSEWPRIGRLSQEECIYIDPTSSTGCLSLNPFLMAEVDVDVRSQVIVGAFKIASDALGDSGHSWVSDTSIVLRHACLILMSQDIPFEELLHFITDQDQREKLLSETKLDASGESVARAAQELRRLAASQRWSEIVSPIQGVLMTVVGDARLSHIVFGKNHVDL